MTHIGCMGGNFGEIDFAQDSGTDFVKVRLHWHRNLFQAPKEGVRGRIPPTSKRDVAYCSL
jgi:hypothetical protein